MSTPELYKIYNEDDPEYCTNEVNEFDLTISSLEVGQAFYAPNSKKYRVYLYRKANPDKDFYSWKGRNGMMRVERIV